MMDKTDDDGIDNSSYDEEGMCIDCGKYREECICFDADDL